MTYKVDVITPHPRCIIYPLWMKQMAANRDLFGDIIVPLTQTCMGRDYSEFITSSVGDAKFTNFDGWQREPNSSWYDVAIKRALAMSTSSHVLFVETDFLVDGDFYKQLIKHGQSHKTIGIVDGNHTKNGVVLDRFHPCCILVERETLDKTGLDFAAYPPHTNNLPSGDHFARVSTDLRKLGDWTTLQDLNLDGWIHMSGLTHNYTRTDNTWKKASQFYTYNRFSIQEPNQPEDWRTFCIAKEKEMGEHPMDEEFKKYLI